MTKNEKQEDKKAKVLTATKTYFVHGYKIEAETIEESIEKYNLLNKE